MLFGKYINKYYLKYWYLFLAGVVALIAVDYVQLFQPEFLGQIVDELRKNGPIDTGLITSICVKMIIVAVIMFIGRMAWRYALFGAARNIEAGLRREMFKKSERLSQRYYHETPVGSIMSWFTTDLESIQEYCGFGTVQMVDAFFLGVLVVYRMFKLDVVLAAFSLIPMLLIVAWGALVEKYMAMKWETRQKEYDKLYDFAQENFTGIRVIKAFVKETSEIHAFAKVAKKNRDANVEFERFSIFFDTVIEIIIGSIMAIILGFGTWFVFSFVSGNPIVFLGHPIELSAGKLITFIGYFDSLIWPLIAMGSLVTMYSRAKTSLKRVTEFIDTEEEVKSPENALKLQNVKGEIEFKDFSFCYPLKKTIKTLKNVSLKINAGESIGIVGRIGSGKTTIASVLLRLYNFDKGSVFIDGKDLMECDIDSVRDAIAYVPQDNFLFSDTIGNNISFAKSDCSDEEIKEAAEFADIADNIEGFENKYDTVTGERGVTLSGGQKQRTAIARAYLKNSPILIMDDSVSAVDVKTEETILKNIREKRAGKTTIVVASRVSTVSHFDKIIVMNGGEVEAFDTPEKLAEISPTYKKMVYLQELEKEVEGGGR